MAIKIGLSSLEMVWCIEYTNDPWLKKSRKKVLERELSESIQRMEGLLKSGSGSRCALGNSGFYVEALYVEASRKSLLLVRDEEGGWVATLTFSKYPCMKVEEARSFLSELGFNEVRPYSLADMLRLSRVKIVLDSLAVDLLRGIFPNVNVEFYYALSHTYVDKRIGHDKEYRRNMESEKPLETLITYSIDKVQGAYIFISQSLSREVDEKMVDKFLDNYTQMVGDYLQSVGLLKTLG